MDDVLKRIVDCIGPKHGAKKELAAYLDLHPNVITNWLSGRNKSYLRYIKQLAEYFDVSEDWLRTGVDPEELSEEEQMLEEIRRNPDMRTMFSVTKNATSEEMAQYIKIIKALRGEEDG